MLTAGALAGLAGSAQVLGTERRPHRGRRGELSASTPSRSPCSAAPSRWARCSPGILFGALRAGGVAHAGRAPGRPSTSCSSCSRSSSCSSRRRRWSGRCSACRHRTRHAPRSRSSPQRRRSAHERPHDRRAGAGAGPAASALVLPPIKLARADRLRRRSRCSGSSSSGCSHRPASTSTFAVSTPRDFIQFTPFSVPSKLTAIVLCLAALALAGRVVLRDAAAGEKAGAWLPITYGVPHGVRVPRVGRRGQGQRAAADRSAAGLAVPRDPAGVRRAGGPALRAVRHHQHRHRGPAARRRVPRGRRRDPHRQRVRGPDRRARRRCPGRACCWCCSRSSTWSTRSSSASCSTCWSSA